MEIQATLSFKNKTLRDLISQLGYKCIQEFCSKNLLPYNSILQIGNFRIGIKNTSGRALISAIQKHSVPQRVIDRCFHKNDIATQLFAKHQSITQNIDALDCDKKLLIDESILNYFPSKDDPSQNALEESVKDEVSYALSFLSKREQLFLNMRYGLNNYKEYSLEEIGQKNNLGIERVRQIIQKAILKLNHNHYGEELRSFYTGNLPTRRKTAINPKGECGYICPKCNSFVIHSEAYSRRNRADNQRYHYECLNENERN